MKNEDDIFTVLGLYGNEKVVSNLLSWLLNPTTGHGFGFKFVNDFLESLKCEKLNEINEIEIITEYHCKINDKKNYIDIVILEKNNDGKVVLIVAIENKVYSSEGVKQTERYFRALKEAKTLNNKDKSLKSDNCNYEFIYLTKSNLPVKLSNKNFKHHKYSELEKVLNEYSTKNKFVDDFYESYIIRDKEKLLELEERTFKDYKDNPNLGNMEKDVCFYVTEKFIREQPDIYCKVCKSAKGGKPFFQVWEQSWNKTINGKPFNIHIEGDSKGVLLHFETSPYIPYKKLDDKTKRIVDKQKKNIKNSMNGLESIKGVEMKKIRGNATLSVGKFIIERESFKEYYKTMKNLVKELDKIIKEIN